MPLADRVLLVAAYWRTNLTLRQLAPLFGVSSLRPVASSIALAPSPRSHHASGSRRTQC
ncbi:transposase family protein [Kitasatospora sp. NPDC002965]|uniref:transposase family protein n=1 Tax=Kitasatospora sp. NPDC002965 TaxID=3154775 RepID=UPI0033BAAF3C